jgi:hypothetical protein
VTPQTARLIGVGCVLVAAASGGVIGYVFANHRLKEYYDKISRREIDEAKVYYATLYKKGSEDINEVAERELGIKVGVGKAFAEMSEAAAQVHRDYAGITPRSNDPRVELVGGTQPPMDIIVQNVFNRALDPGNRTEEAPYIVSKDEYFAEDQEYEQKTLTYYAGDGALTEQDDTLIDPPEVDEMVGENNLPHFGHLSEDPNVLYVRNDVLEIDYELLLNGGKYSEIVAGLSEN